MSAHTLRIIVLRKARPRGWKTTGVSPVAAEMKSLLLRGSGGLVENLRINRRVQLNARVLYAA